MSNPINHFTFTQRDEIGILEFNTPNSNANILSSDALKEFNQQIDAIAALEHVPRIADHQRQEVNLYCRRRTSRRLRL